MRASLVSATSLLALLIAQEGPAVATPVLSDGQTTIDFGYDIVGDGSSTSKTNSVSVTGGSGTTIRVSAPTSPFALTTPQPSSSLTGTGTVFVPETFTFGALTRGAASQTVTVTDSGSGSTPLTLTLTGTGVAPVASVPANVSGYLLVGTQGTLTMTVGNTGNGNLVSGTAGNLVGTIGSTSSVFTSTQKSFSLNDSNYNSVNGVTTAVTTATNTYTYTPTVRGGVATATVSTVLANGANASNQGGTVATTLTATGVAPVQSVTSAGTNTIRVGTTAVSTLTVANTGNGNLSGLGSISNLRGSVSASLGTGVTASAGNPTAVSLADSATTTLAYTYAPVSRGTTTSTVTFNFANGNANGSNTAQSVSSVFTNQAVGPVYTSSVTGSGATNTPAPVAGGSVGAASSTISFGTVGYKQSTTVYLALQNTTSDTAGSLTNLTIERFSIAGADASYFSVPTFTANSIISKGGQLVLPIAVANNLGAGVLTSSLTIFTDESASLGGTGDTFTYFLTAVAVPEPATLAVLGAGLAGLAGMRRRRR